MRQGIVAVVVSVVGMTGVPWDHGAAGELATTKTQTSPAVASSVADVHPGLPDGATEGESRDPAVHLNYATVLFYRGQSLLQGGKIVEGKTIFKDIERELLLAMQLSEAVPDGVGRRLLRSQCAFLLGDLYAFVFNDPAKAKVSYQDSLTNFPGHEGASAALKRFDSPKAVTP